MGVITVMVKMMDACVVIAKNKNFLNFTVNSLQRCSIVIPVFVIVLNAVISLVPKIYGRMRLSRPKSEIGMHLLLKLAMRLVS